MKTKVLVVDDSAVMRRVLGELIAQGPEFEVVGAAPDANSAREMIKNLRPDLLTLDVNMPGLNGLDFLERLMRLRPMPVVMVSAFTAEGTEATLKAFELGAVEVIGKPRMGNPALLADYTDELLEKLRAASRARTRSARPAVAPPRDNTPPPKSAEGHAYGGGPIIYLGASTGGTEAIRSFLGAMPADCPPILMVQHMPEMFTGSFARRLDSLCAPRVIESQGNEPVRTGTVYLAPGHSHLSVRRQGGNLVTELSRGEPVNRHRPSVDVLFRAAATVSGSKAIGVILTGMGKDGAAGLKSMRDAGAWTYAQDEASCVVFGMPREAIQQGAACEVLPLERIAGALLARIGSR